MNYINWDYYVAAAEEKSFTRAAKRLFISQQSLSSHIAKIEEYYGVELFDRKNNMTLTEAGESLYRSARRMVDIERQTVMEMKDIRDFQSSCLRIGVSTHRGARILPVLLPKLKAEYPNVKIQLVEKRLGELKQDLLDGKIDLMFGYREEERSDIVEEFYSVEEMKIVVPEPIWNRYFSADQKRELEGRERVSLKEFAQCPFLSLSPGNWLYNQLKEYCSERNLELKVELLTSNLTTMLNLCIAGMGFIVCPDLYLNPEFIGEQAKRSLRVFEIDSDKMSQDRVVKYLNSRYVPKITKEFIRIIRENLGEKDPLQPLPVAPQKKNVCHERSSFV